MKATEVTPGTLLKVPWMDEPVTIEAVVHLGPRRVQMTGDHAYIGNWDRDEEFPVWTPPELPDLNKRPKKYEISLRCVMNTQVKIVAHSPAMAENFIERMTSQEILNAAKEYNAGEWDDDFYVEIVSTQEVR